MEHMLPHAFTARGSIIPPLENAVHHIVTLLYKNTPFPDKPKSNKTARKHQRNAQIEAEYAVGTSVPALAQKYGISVARVYQILGSQRK